MTPGVIVQTPSEVSAAGAVPAGWLTPEIEPYLGRNTGPYPVLYRPVNGGTGNDTINLPPIPIEWIVSPQNITSKNQCPTAEGTIRTFVAADLILALVLIVTAFRPFLYRTTLHAFGKRGGRQVYLTWVFWFALQLIGNLGASLVIVNTPGYGHLGLANVFALYASRPRLKPWWLAILRTLVTVDGHRFPDGHKRIMTEAEAQAAGEKSKQDISPHDGDVEYEEVEHPYVDSYILAALIEITFQIVAAVFIGVTWKRFPNEIIKDFMQPALIYMFVAPVITFLAALVGVPVWRLSGDAWGLAEKEDLDPQTGKLIRRWTPKDMRAIRVTYAVWGSLFFIPAYAAAWVYWTHFLTLPGAL